MKIIIYKNNSFKAFMSTILNVTSKMSAKNPSLIFPKINCSVNLVCGGSHLVHEANICGKLEKKYRALQHNVNIQPMG